jgi:hypothetical protein
VRLLTVSRARHYHPPTLYLNTEILDRKVHLLDQPHEYGRFLRVQPSGATEAKALCAGGVPPTPNLRSTPFANWIKPIGRSFHWVESSIAPLVTVASVLSRLEPSSASDTRTSLVSLEARYGLGRYFCPGSFPSFEACPVLSLISPPIKMKMPLRYIQVSSTITVPMLPEVALYKPYDSHRRGKPEGGEQPMRATAEPGVIHISNSTPARS